MEVGDAKATTALLESEWRWDGLYVSAGQALFEPVED
jgi:hypothetical protein